jgi:D-alanyl-lipoteichoic acid acyltransferase DltB (MBOAT superfamily)
MPATDAVQGFWRGWHSSFNQWLVRYLYIPLGGSRRRAAIIWPIFFFVAVWHDLEVRQPAADLEE